MAYWAVFQDRFCCITILNSEVSQSESGWLTVKVSRQNNLKKRCAIITIGFILFCTCVCGHISRFRVHMKYAKRQRFIPVLMGVSVLFV